MRGLEESNKGFWVAKFQLLFHLSLAVVVNTKKISKVQYM